MQEIKMNHNIVIEKPKFYFFHWYRDAELSNTGICV